MDIKNQMIDPFVHQETCVGKHKELDFKIDSLIIMTGKINKRLYEDNGDVSLQSRINKQDILIESFKDDVSKLEKNFNNSCTEIKNEIKKIKEKNSSFFKNTLDIVVKILIIGGSLYALFIFLHRTA